MKILLMWLVKVRYTVAVAVAYLIKTVDLRMQMRSAYVTLKQCQFLEIEMMVIISEVSIS